MNTTLVNTSGAQRGSSAVLARMACLLMALGTGAVTLAACADKELTTSNAALSPRIALQVTATGLPAAQVSTSQLWLMVGAVYATPKAGDNDGIRVLALKFTRVVSGTQEVTLPVDISTCLADNSRLGSKDACSMYLAAAILTDTFSMKDTVDVDPFMKAYDYAFPVGPFDVAPGRAPSVPAIDLSLSRFAVREWAPDEALRLGGAVNPNHFTGVLGLPTPIAGVSSGTGAPTLFSLVRGSDFPAPTSTGSFNFQQYPQLQIFENGTWRRVTATTAASSVNFTDLTAFATNDVYIASTGGLFRYDGSSVAKVSGLTDSTYSIAGTTSGSTKYVIAGGAGGSVWIGNGTAFQRYSLPTSSRIDGVCITGPSEAFAGNGATALLYRFDGTSWTVVSGQTTGGKIDLQCPAPGQVFVMTQGGPPLKWTSSGWTQLPTTGIGPLRALRWGVVSANEIYAYADSGATDRAFYRFDGSTWREVGRERWAQTGGRPWADPRGGAAYAISPFGRLEKITASGATVLSYQPALRDAFMTSSSSAFVVGWNTLLARWDGVKWNVDAPPAGTPAVRILQGVWSDGPKNAWAVGNSSTVLRYDGAGWSIVSDVTKPVTGVSDNYNAVWGAGTDVWIAGDNGITHCKSATACSIESQGGAMFSIWGSSASNIFAVGGGGQIRRYNGTSWSAMNSPTGRTLVRVSGSGPSDVWAVGDSVLVHFDGTGWSPVSLATNSGSSYSRSPSNLQSLFQLGLWARGPKEVYMGGDNGVISRWDGTEWHEMIDHAPYRRRIIAITGDTGGCGIAITEGQSDLLQPTLWRGIGPSGCNALPMTPPASWP